MNKQDVALADFDAQMAQLRRRALAIGIPVTLVVGYALSRLIEAAHEAPLVARTLAFFLSASVATLYFAQARHEITRAAMRALKKQNTAMHNRLIERDVESNYDGLTGLPNTRLLSDRFEQATLRSQRGKSHLAMYAVTIDDFNPISKRYGSDAATQVVQATANRLRGVLRDSDTIVRVGRSDFVVLAESVNDLKHIQAMEEKMLAALG
ncbi:MAG: diguanylate cyclase domain-containing protein, partial [Rhodoferax sp.]